MILAIRFIAAIAVAAAAWLIMVDASELAGTVFS